MKNNDKQQEAINKIVYCVNVPKGLRPTTAEETDQMLGALGGNIPSNDKLESLLKRVKGELPIFKESVSSPEFIDDSEVCDNELMAMHRDGNDDLSPESKKILEDMKKRALKEEENQSEEEGNSNK